MRVLLIDNGTTLLDKLRTLIPGSEIVQQPNRVSIENSKTFDLIVLSGSKDLTVKYDIDYFSKEIELIQNTQVPLIGICLGCELLATAFGGTVRRLDERHSGIREIIAITDDEVLGLRRGEARSVYEGHRWIIEKMPEDFKILTESNDGPEIIQHNSRPIWGFQFHPENFVDQTTGDEMFLNLFSKVSNDS
ncbi:MAG: gamma-glutamyl-gamma-aminobutyrate hydrolase family protein [bacterium]|nr:gamma-glutamyl-gamma-aminobutyrate hydrolase family protein [bacterium]